MLARFYIAARNKKGELYKFFFLFLYGFFPWKTKLQSRGLTEKLSQIHGNSRNLHHKYFNLKETKIYKLIQNTQYINNRKGRGGGEGGGGGVLHVKFKLGNEGYPFVSCFDSF